jgi:hypothetical protein
VQCVAWVGVAVGLGVAMMNLKALPKGVGRTGVAHRPGLVCWRWAVAILGVGGLSGPCVGSLRGGVMSVADRGGPQEFDAQLKKLMEGNVSLIDTLGSARLALHAAFSQAFKNKEVRAASAGRTSHLHHHHHPV